MAGGTKSRKKHQPIMSAETYQHPYADSPMRPEVGVQREFRKKRAPRTYCYDSSLAPALDWDGQNPARELGEWLLALIEEAAGLEPPHVFPSAAGIPERPRPNPRQRAARGGGHAQAPQPAVPELGRQGRAPLLRRAHPAAVRPRAALHQGHLETLKGHQRDTGQRQVHMLDLFGDPQHIRSPTRCCAPTSTATTGSTA